MSFANRLIIISIVHAADGSVKWDGKGWYRIRRFLLKQKTTACFLTTFLTILLLIPTLSIPTILERRTRRWLNVSATQGKARFEYFQFLVICLSDLYASNVYGNTPRVVGDKWTSISTCCPQPLEWVPSLPCIRWFIQQSKSLKSATPCSRLPGWDETPRTDLSNQS